MGGPRWSNLEMHAIKIPFTGERVSKCEASVLYFWAAGPKGRMGTISTSDTKSRSSRMLTGQVRYKLSKITPIPKRRRKIYRGSQVIAI